jgi:hypothetical protein
VKALIGHGVLILAPLCALVLIAFGTGTFTTTHLVVAAALIALEAAAISWLVVRLRNDDFRPRYHTEPSYTAEAEISVDGDERRKAFETQKRFDD